MVKLKQLALPLKRRPVWRGRVDVVGNTVIVRSESVPPKSFIKYLERRGAQTIVALHSVGIIELPAADSREPAVRSAGRGVQ